MKTSIAFRIKTELAKGIKTLKEIDGRSQTYHIERALTNYLKAKKVTVNENTKSKK